MNETTDPQTAAPAAHLGSCLCGAVRFRIDGAFARFYLCHCSRCRKGTGSAHAANLFAPAAALTWICGPEQVRTYRLTPTRHARSFCSVCGSALPREENGALVVPAGALDTTLDLRPDAHIFTASSADWDHDLHHIAMHAAFPG